MRLLTLPVHAACHSDGAPTGRTLLPVLVIHGVLGFICVGGGGGGSGFLQKQSCCEHPRSGSGCPHTEEWNLRLGLATEFAGPDTEQNRGPWDKSSGVSTRQLQSLVPGAGWATTWVQDASLPPPRAKQRACAVRRPLAHRMVHIPCPHLHRTLTPSL